MPLWIRVKDYSFSKSTRPIRAEPNVQKSQWEHSMLNKRTPRQMRLLLIGWESGTIFQDQSQSELLSNYFRESVEMALIMLSERGIFCMSLCLSLFLIILIATVSAFTYLFERKKSRVHGNQNLCMNFASLLGLSSVLQLSIDLRITIKQRPDHC